MESRAAGVLKRFEGMKLEINEWKTSAESQFISMDAINYHFFIFTKHSQDLAKKDIMTGVEISLCGRISDYKTDIARIKEKMHKKIKSRSNMTSSSTSLSGNRVIRGELNISSIDSPIDSDKDLNPYRLGLDLPVSEHSEDPDENPIIHQIGTGFNDGLGNTGYQNVYRNGHSLIHTDLNRISLLMII